MDSRIDILMFITLYINTFSLYINMEKTFAEDTEFKKQEFEKQHNSLNEMVQWLKVWDKYNTTNKRDQPQSNSKNKRMR